MEYGSQINLVHQDKTRNNSRNVCFIRLGIFLTFACFLVLICVGIIIVDPYRKSNNFKSARCEVLSSDYTGTYDKCSCSGRYCQSKFPCLHVTVNVTVDNEITTWTTLLRNSEIELSYNKHKCAYRPEPCWRDEFTNELLVQDYRQDYGLPGQTYDCWYNPNSQNTTIRKRQYEEVVVIHAMLWPSIGAFVGIIVTVIAIIRWNSDKKAIGG